jgi:DNA-binding beta-propeller fold protein YncE
VIPYNFAKCFFVEFIDAFRVKVIHTVSSGHWEYFFGVANKRRGWMKGGTTPLAPFQLDGPPDVHCWITGEEMNSSTRFHEFRPIALLSCLLCFLPLHAGVQSANDAKAAQLQKLLEQAPTLPLERVPITIQPPSGENWALGRVTSIALSRDKSLAYVMMRDDAAHPVIVIDRNGRVVRSWGAGMFQVPHNVAVDPDGNVWTTDAGSGSRILKFTPDGKKIQEFAIPDDATSCAYPATPSNGGRDFCGVTDIIFISSGRIVLTDGYGKMRIMVYTVDGTKIRDWGGPGKGPGQFQVPHGLGYDGKVLFVADRQNGRIERFDINGHFLGEWTHLGQPGSLRFANGALWMMLRTLEEPPDKQSSWVVKVDPATGKILGKIAGNVGTPQQNHFIGVSEDGEEIVSGFSPKGIFWYRPKN